MKLVGIYKCLVDELHDDKDFLDSEQTFPISLNKSVVRIPLRSRC